MTASPIRRLRRTLEAKGYEPCEPDMLGSVKWTLPLATDIYVFPNMGEFTIKAAHRDIERDSRHRDPELTNESARRQSAWEQEESARLEREAADVARVKDLRLGGVSKVLTEQQVDAISRRAEQLATERQRMERLMRAKPLAG